MEEIPEATAAAIRKIAGAGTRTHSLTWLDSTAEQQRQCGNTDRDAELLEVAHEGSQSHRITARSSLRSSFAGSLTVIRIRPGSTGYSPGSRCRQLRATSFSGTQDRAGVRWAARRRTRTQTELGNKAGTWGGRRSASGEADPAHVRRCDLDVGDDASGHDHSSPAVVGEP